MNYFGVPGLGLVNRLTEGGVCFQICLIFMNVLIFVSRIVDFLKI